MVLMASEKNKKTYKYIKCCKVYEEELTWDMFIKGLNEYLEFSFCFQGKTIDIAFHYENGLKMYELNIFDGEIQTNYIFDTIEELVCFQAFNNRSLQDIWGELKT